MKHLTHTKFLTVIHRLAFGKDAVDEFFPYKFHYSDLQVIDKLSKDLYTLGRLESAEQVLSLIETERTNDNEI